MKNREGRTTFQPDRNPRMVPIAIMFVLLCGLSFYLGGIFCSEKERYEVEEVTKALESAKNSSEPIDFPECSIDYQDYTPCTDPKVPL